MTTQTFTRHGEEVTLGHSSKMCLSCHDGVTAVGSYGNMAGTDPITGGAAIGTDLTNDHPIGVDYATSSSHGLEPVEDVERYLEDGKVECGSCHYAHGGRDNKFLNTTIAGSALCRNCHQR
jgi:predicted CXXCH cytochrome family protein